MTAVAPKGPTLRGFFDRLDADKSGDIDRAEVKKHLEGLGLGKGLLGGQKVNKGADAFMKKLGAGPESRVSWAQFVSGGSGLLPPGLLDANKKKLDPARVDGVFDQIAGSAGQKADIEAVRSFVSASLSNSGGGAALALLAPAIADGAARIAIDVLDADGDHAFTRQDLKSLVDDINSEIAKTA